MTPSASDCACARLSTVAPWQPGRVILLNGGSSSGKTSLAKALLPLLAEPWFHLPVDAIGALRSPTYTHQLDDAEVQEMLAAWERRGHPTAFDRMRAAR